MGHGDGREIQEGGNICTPVTISCGCMAEMNTTLYINYPPIEKKFLIKKHTKALDSSACPFFLPSPPPPWALIPWVLPNKLPGYNSLSQDMFPSSI